MVDSGCCPDHATNCFLGFELLLSRACETVSLPPGLQFESIRNIATCHARECHAAFAHPYPGCLAHPQIEPLSCCSTTRTRNEADTSETGFWLCDADFSCPCSNTESRFGHSIPHHKRGPTSKTSRLAFALTPATPPSPPRSKNHLLVASSRR